jgi:hypothetical protein
MENLSLTTSTDSKMLSYSKTILEKMSFDRRLLWKEYRKSIRHLTHYEYKELREWVRARFSRKNQPTLINL